MAQRDPDVSQDRAVGKVALQAGNRQLGCQVLKEGIGNPKVSLGILKVDRVYLMRHGGGSHFPFPDLLLEIVHGDVGPDIPVQIDQDGVDTLQPVKEGGHMVVMLYLGRRE